jgi:hypothetical protein
MALLLAAHEINPTDHKITNELGVMYARFGDLPKAEMMLKRSLVAREHSESWHNLSRVWEMAGKSELAQYGQTRSAQLRNAGGSFKATNVRVVAPDQLIASAAPPAELALGTAKPSGSPRPAAAKSPGQPNWFEKMLSKSPFAIAGSKETTTR